VVLYFLEPHEAQMASPTSACCLLGLLLLGCGSDESRVSVIYEGGARVPSEELQVTIEEPSHHLTFEAGNLSSPTVTVVPSLRTSSRGSLQIDYTMIDGTTQMSSGGVNLDLRPDWEWGVSIQADSLNPVQRCFGCFGSKPFPLLSQYRRNARDSIWVTWGGNSISHPVIY
jgi:hypothetical protein